MFRFYDWGGGLGLNPWHGGCRWRRRRRWGARRGHLGQAEFSLGFKEDSSGLSNWGCYRTLMIFQASMYGECGNSY